MNYNHGLRSSIFALVATMAATSPALAQQPQSGIPDGEIIVTATRSESLASKTPVALTAVTGDTLTAQGITNPTSLAEQVPNLSIDRSNGLQITIRGVTSTDNTEKGDPSAAFMTDGIYIARSQAQEVSFFDVARVEVLRGPQGTLFGRNTTAGLVNIITQKPQLGKFSGSLEGAYGNYNTQQATGVLNVPLGDSVALRGAVNYDRRDSYLREGSNWRTDLSPFKKNLSGRLSALFDLGDGELLIRGDYSSIKGNTANGLLLSNFYSTPIATGVDPVYRANGKSAKSLLSLNVPYSGPLERDNDTWGVMADFNYDLGPVTVSYLGSYRKFNRHEDTVSLLADGSRGVPGRFDGNYWQNSQELRLSSNSDGPLKAQAGLYYFKEKSGIDYHLFGLLSQTPGTVGYVFGFPQDPTISKSWAGFGQLTYSLTDALRVTGGVRYSKDDKSRVGFTVRCGSIACDQPGDIRTPNVAERKFSKTTWRAGIDYDVNARTLLYGVVATGYKAGGFNDGCEIGTGANCTLRAEALYYNPETLTSYEMGIKTRFADNAVRLNLSAFHYDYKSIQLSQLSDICGGPCNVTTNAGAAKVDGIELEGVINPVRSSRLDFAVSWLNARYDEFFPQPTIDWSGKKLDRSPSIVVTAGYTQTFELGNGGNIQAGVRSRLSDSYELAALATVNQFRVPSYTKTDLLLSYNAPGDRWYVQGFLKNIENSIVVTTVSVGSLSSLQVADPRTYGARVGFRF
ncbi:TonB-dependent receptor [Sphingobium sp. BYY-5]|uniref:TonB-dependent receptor n=1 Tax=Sphingobium sp. BYY-5 TaxID=2926400 RepID=UPI001FA77BEE|nr:TonB-dependent receptor [Sphingobium sp. BYY-5]